MWFGLVLAVIGPLKELCVPLSPPLSYRRFDLGSFGADQSSLNNARFTRGSP